jgi:transcriptional regulator with XRE-family HTH domain
MKKPHPLWKPERNKQILEEYNTTNITVEQLADKHGVTPQRISQILKAEAHRQQEEEHRLLEMANRHNYD